MKGKAELQLVYLLAVVVVTEYTGYYIGSVLHKRNIEYYNVSTMVEFVIYFNYFKEILNRKKIKFIANLCFYIYPILWLLNILFIQGFYHFHTYTMLLGGVLTILFSILYFQELLLLYTRIDPIKTAAFWICTGLLFFYTVDLINDYLLTFTHSIKFSNTKMTLFKIINHTLNIILYSCFIIAFRCYRKNKT